MSLPLDYAETQTQIQLIADVRLLNYVVVASLTLFVYDYLLTFQEEVELIWMGSSWKSFMKIFYVS